MSKIIVEENAVDNLKIWLRNSGQITPNIKANDKTKFVDGNIKINDLEGNILGTLEVQVKGISKQCKKNPTYSIKKEFLEHCKSQNIPIILIVVYNNKKAFWMHMSQSVCDTYLHKMKESQKTTTLHFDDKYYIQSNHTKHCIDEFTNIINLDVYKLSNFDKVKNQRDNIERDLIEINKQQNISIGKTNPIHKEIHIFLDFYNNLLDNDFRGLKNIIYPNYWKIGVGYYDYLDNAINFILYPVSYELNDVQIKQFTHDNIQNHDGLVIKWNVCYVENPIKKYPEQYAYECIKEDLFNRLFGNLKIQLFINDLYLATEYLFDFINNCYINLNLAYGQHTYLLVDIERGLNILENNCVQNLPEFNVNVARQLIQYLMGININGINKDNYFKLFGLEATNIIAVRRKFYEVMPKIYNLLVKVHFPNLMNDLNFFNNFNLLIIVFDSSPNYKMTSGLELAEQHYYLQSSNELSTNQIIIYDNFTDCPINLHEMRIRDKQLLKIHQIRTI